MDTIKPSARPRALSRLAYLWSVYRPCKLPVRLHVTARYLTCPFEEMLKYFPERGEVLDVGCGHGLLLALLLDGSRPGLRGMGMDPDPGKIAAARAAGPGGVRFSTGGLEAIEAGRCDCVILTDVLYTVPLEAWPGLLSGCARVLKPEGRLLVKEVVDRPRWKHAWAYLQERLALDVFGWTRGASPHFESANTCRRFMREAGFEVYEERRLDRGRPHAHRLFLARKAG